MNLRELNNFSINDAINFHDELNPQLFMNDHMRKSVRKKLLKISRHFREFLGVDDIALVDITVSGSNAAYSYTPHSDIDLHLLVDFTKLSNDDVYKELFNSKKYQYNEQHSIKIKGYDVELYVQDAAQVHTSLGEYSILHDRWNIFPSKKRAHLNDDATREKYEMLEQLAIRALASNKLDYIKRVLETIARYRKAGLVENGEFGPENLAFKILRKKGYFKKLWDAKRAIDSKDLSMENTESIDLTEDYIKYITNGSSRSSVMLEAVYKGNIGLEEVIKFHKVATQKQLKLFQRLLDANKNKEAWKLMQKVIEVQLHEEGKIIPGVNTTKDVGPHEIQKQANKFNLSVDKDGKPISIYESIKLTELKMAPGTLSKQVQKLISEIEPEVGLEFEVVIPINDDLRDPENELEFDDDLSLQDLKDHFDFLDPGEHDKLFAELQNEYFEWLSEQYMDWLSVVLPNPDIFVDAKIDVLMGVQSDEYNELLEKNNIEEVTVKIARKIIEETEKYLLEYDFDEIADDNANDYVMMYYTVFVDHETNNPGRELFSEYVELDDAWVQEYDRGLNMFLNLEYGVLREEDFSNRFGIPIPISNEIVFEWFVGILNDNGLSASTQYHSNYDVTVVKEDPSIEPDGENEIGMEIAMAHAPYLTAIEDIKLITHLLKEHGAYTNESTGLHINISAKGINFKEVDPIKLAILSGDSYILEQFDRVYNQYAKETKTQLRIHITPEEVKVLLQNLKNNMDEELRKYNYILNTKYSAIHMHGGRMEVRAPGGENYLYKMSDIINTINRFIVLYSIAANPNAYRQEYLKKLYKYLDSFRHVDEEDITFNMLFSKYCVGKLEKTDMRLVDRIRRNAELSPTEVSEHARIEALANKHNVPVSSIERMIHMIAQKVRANLHTPISDVRTIVISNLEKDYHFYDRLLSIKESIELTELKMSPTSLAKGVQNVLKKAQPIVGLEFEVCIPWDREIPENQNIADDYTLDDILEYFEEDIETYDVDVDGIREDINNKFINWKMDQISESIGDPNRFQVEKIDVMLNFESESFDEFKNELGKAGIKFDVDFCKKAIDHTKRQLKDVYSEAYELVFIDDENRDESRELLEQLLEDSNDDMLSLSYFLIHDLSIHDMYNFAQYFEIPWHGNNGPSTGYFNSRVGDEIAYELDENGISAYTIADPDLVNDYDELIITYDSSIIPNDQSDSGLELIMPKTEYEEARENISTIIDILKQRHAYTNDSTGLHINISIEGIDHSSVDPLKMAILSGDVHILKQFGREFNNNATQMITQMKQQIKIAGYKENKPDVLANLMKHLRTNLNDLAGESVFDFTEKYASINFHHDRIEVRAAGGEGYLDRLDDIFNTINRFIVIYSISADPNAYRNEYGKKLYKVLSSFQPEGENDTFLKLFAKYCAGDLSKDAMNAIYKTIKKGTVDSGQDKSSEERISDLADKHNVDFNGLKNKINTLAINIGDTIAPNDSFDHVKEIIITNLEKDFHFYDGVFK